MPKILLVVLVFLVCLEKTQLFLPIQVSNRQGMESIKLTDIGAFGLLRKARPKVPAHYHTGIDLKRPSGNYANEPVLAAGKGKVISLRNDGPYAQIIVEHAMGPQDTIWTVYEHISVGNCHVGNRVTERTIIARFFNRTELDKYGWQFNHVHFEMLRVRPVKIKPTRQQPECFYKTYAITCFTREELYRRMIDPLHFFNRNR